LLTFGRVSKKSPQTRKTTPHSCRGELSLTDHISEVFLQRIFGDIHHGWISQEPFSEISQVR
jgi:hypothetical protein